MVRRYIALVVVLLLGTTLFLATPRAQTEYIRLITGGLLFGTGDARPVLLGNDGKGYLKVDVGGAVSLINGATLSSPGFRSTQSTPPVCSTNCGTSPIVVGGDSAMRVTMGSGSPASGFLITFGGTFASAPACSGTMGKTGMAVGKFPITMVTTTTTVTVVTYTTAPSAGDIYNILCTGVA